MVIDLITSNDIFPLFEDSLFLSLDFYVSKDLLISAWQTILIIIKNLHCTHAEHLLLAI